MRRSSRWSERVRDRLAVGTDRGSASLEFITVGVLMLVPLVYLVIALGQIQGQAMGAEAGSRHLARAIAMAPDAAAATERANAVLASIEQEYGLDPGALDVRIVCVPSSGPCPQPGATLTVTVSTRVSLPLAPPMLDLDRVLSVPVEATASQKVSRFWGAP